MRRQRMVLVCLLAFLVTACNRGSPTSPDPVPPPPPPTPHALSGTWRYTGDNFPDDAVGKLTACMIAHEEVVPDTAAWVAENGMDWSARNAWLAPSIPFTQDSPYTTANDTSSGYSRIALQVSLPTEPDRTTSGTWVVSGAQQVLIEDGPRGEKIELTFAVNGYKSVTSSVSHSNT